MPGNVSESVSQGEQAVFAKPLSACGGKMNRILSGPGESLDAPGGA